MTNLLEFRDFFRFHNRDLSPLTYHLSLIFLLFPFASLAADSAVYSVNQGLRFYLQGNYDAALLAFEEAGKLAPNDFRITYNQACTYLAAGRSEEAMEKFRASAFAPDRNLVYDSLLTLGNIAVDRASSYLSEPLEKTASGNRKRFLVELLVAEKEFADAIGILPNRVEAKDNLEAIRLWKNTLETRWKEGDRNHRAESLSLAEHLNRIEQSQQTICRKTAAETERTDSPKKFQTLYLLAKEQADLIPEIEVFWKKFQAEYLAPDRTRFEELNRHIANSVGSLKSYDGKSVLPFQSATLEILNAIQNDLRDDSQAEDIEGGKNSPASEPADLSENANDPSPEQPQSLEELVDSFADNLTEHEPRHPASDVIQTSTEGEELSKAQERANELVRAVKKRQQDAEKFRNEIRRLVEPTKKREPKDW
ncbi:MAG: hypothetical protein FWC43_07230 [Planctomycetaceae bacterium]|nr:hypothetical protein [Planctomycetaceae bacterium]